jgi:predicted DNA binding CopG/RHH family protein
VQGIGLEVYACMKKPIKYTNEPLGRLNVVEDFLPTPSELVYREDTEKVTIALSKRSVDFFRKEARLNGTQYQRMIRALLDRYADAHSTSNKRVDRSRGR